MCECAQYQMFCCDSVLSMCFSVAVKYDPDVEAAIAAVRSDEDDTNWYSEVGRAVIDEGI